MYSLQKNEYILKLYDKNHRRLFQQGMNAFYGQRENIEDVEECIQDVFFEAYQKYDLLVVHENVDAWLSVAMRYRIQKTIRKNKRIKTCLVCSLDDQTRVKPDVAGTTDTGIDAVLDKECVQALLRVLSEQEQDLLRERYIAQESITDMAMKRNTTAGTIRALLSVARKRARKKSMNAIYET